MENNCVERTLEKQLETLFKRSETADNKELCRLNVELRETAKLLWKISNFCSEKLLQVSE